MSSSLRTVGRASLLTLALFLLTGSVATAASTWKLEQPAPPDGVPFSVPLGAPGDIQFNGPNAGLLAIEGNSTIARGLYFYDGQEWRSLSTVCGGAAETTRVIWASTTEWWTVTNPSPPRAGSGLGLCHFKDGRVIGSYSTADDALDPFRRMNAGACRAPDDCWFAGIAGQDGTGERSGAFHLHWDGTDLQTSYNPQGRAVSDLVVVGDTIFESSLVGVGPDNNTVTPDLEDPEPTGPQLLRTLGDDGEFVEDPFVIAPATPIEADSELYSIESDSDGDLWAAGGGAASGPDAPSGDAISRTPPVLRYTGGNWQSVNVSGAGFGPKDRIVAIAPIPGSADAMAAVTTYAARRSTTAKARVARISPDGTTTFVSLPGSGSGRGSAARLTCSAPEECWMVTWSGWVFHYTDGTTHPKNLDPAFDSLITFRLNESAEQFVPDTPPVDDSLLFAPPPATDSSAIGGGTTRLKAALRSVKTKLKGTTLVITFKTRRRVRVQMLAKKGGKTIAKSRNKWVAKGKKGTLTIKLNPANWPSKLRFKIKDPSAPSSSSTGSPTVPASPEDGPINDDSVTT